MSEEVSVHVNEKIKFLSDKCFLISSKYRYVTVREKRYTEKNKILMPKLINNVEK